MELIRQAFTLEMANYHPPATSARFNPQDYPVTVTYHLSRQLPPS